MWSDTWITPLGGILLLQVVVAGLIWSMIDRRRQAVLAPFFLACGIEAVAVTVAHFKL